MQIKLKFSRGICVPLFYMASLSTFEDSYHVWNISEINFDILSSENPYTSYVETIVDKYWRRRYEYWPNFDEGIMTDIEGLYSVTPYKAAIYMARECDKYYPCDSDFIVDVCCGVGGNTIAFAECINDAHVVGVDIDQTRLKCAENNADVSGVKIEFVKEDAFEYLSKQKNIRFIFCSPPWGGPSHKCKTWEDIPIDVRALIDLSKLCCNNNEPRIALFLPREFSNDVADSYTPEGTYMYYYNISSNRRFIGKLFMYGFPSEEENEENHDEDYNRDHNDQHNYINNGECDQKNSRGNNQNYGEDDIQCYQENDDCLIEKQPDQQDHNGCETSSKEDIKDQTAISQTL